MTDQNTFAIAELQQKANDGDAQAQFDLALCYAKGTDVKGNTELAFEWHKKAAEQGHVNAQFALGLYYLIGKDGKYTKSLEADLVKLGRKCINDWFLKNGVDPVLDLAYRQALARKFSGSDYDLGFVWIKKAAEQNHTEAQYYLALCYFEGIGIEQKYELAFEWFKKAAEQNYAEAQYRLARCYLEGKGVEKNNGLAIEWFKKAAEQDVFEAQLELAGRYFEGRDVEQSYSCGLKWYKKAEEQSGDDYNWAEQQADRDFYKAEGQSGGAQNWLVQQTDMFANRDFDDEKFTQDDKSAFVWLTDKFAFLTLIKEAFQDDAEAQYQLALCYQDGRCVEIDYPFAFAWMVEAAKAGHAEANQWLADACIQIVFPYFSGRENMDQCCEFAFDWLLIALKENNEQDLEVNFCLGVLYMIGKGVKKNHELAVIHFKKCLDEGEFAYQRDDDFVSSIMRFSSLFMAIISREFTWELCMEQDLRRLASECIVINTKKPILVLPALRNDFHYSVGEFKLLEQFWKSFEYENTHSVFDKSSSRKSFRNMSLTASKQAEELKHKNQQLQEAKKELEDMMSMFAHKFRSPLDAIIYNTTHENQVKLYTEAAQTMRGLLDIFSLISTDATLLKRKLMADNYGNGRLITTFSKALDMVLLHLLTNSNREKVRQHYIAHAKLNDKVDSNISRKVWREDYFELEQSLQTDWEQGFATLILQSASLTDKLDWVSKYFFPIQLIGFDREDIEFEEYGITESLLMMVINEIAVNVFKYYSCETKRPVIIEWVEKDGSQVISCRNPSYGSERTIFKGSQKGHVFLSTLARNIGSHFVKPIPQDEFVVEFGIPNELLISNK